MVEYYPGWAAEAFGFASPNDTYGGMSNAIGAGQVVPPPRRPRPSRNAPRNAPEAPRKPARRPRVRVPPVVMEPPPPTLPDWQTTVTPEAQSPQQMHRVGVGRDIFDPEALAGPSFESNRPSMMPQSSGSRLMDLGPEGIAGAVMRRLNATRNQNIFNRASSNISSQAPDLDILSRPRSLTTPQSTPFETIGGPVSQTPQTLPPDLSNTLGGDPEDLMPRGGFAGEPELPSGLSGIAQSIMMYLNDIRDRNIANREARRARQASGEEGGIRY